jgi:hypothetical protein
MVGSVVERRCKIVNGLQSCASGLPDEDIFTYIPKIPILVGFGLAI